MAGPLVVKGEAVVGSAHAKWPAGHLDPSVAGRRRRGPLPRVTPGQSGQEQRLAHRLLVLKLVAGHHRGDRAVAGALALEHGGGAIAHLAEVGTQRVAAQEVQVAAHRARGLEGVVEVGQLGAKQGQAPVTVGDPEVLVGGDMPQVPGQRAHHRCPGALQDGVIETLDEGCRSLPRHVQRTADAGCAHHLDGSYP